MKFKRKQFKEDFESVAGVILLFLIFLIVVCLILLNVNGLMVLMGANESSYFPELIKYHEFAGAVDLLLGLAFIRMRYFK